MLSRLVFLGGWRDLRGSMGSVIVECGQRNLGVAGICRCIVCVVWFSGVSWGFYGIRRVRSEESWWFAGLRRCGV